jgi:hypothetical protein
VPEAKDKLARRRRNNCNDHLYLYENPNRFYLQPVSEKKTLLKSGVSRFFNGHSIAL